jgi:N-acetylmuramoyl-L-alanine amidase
MPARRSLVREAPPLPAIPLVEGPLAPVLVFPEANSAITTRDSNFVFGSVGNGNASLTINGAPVAVAPNGTFLAFLPVPPPSAPRYEIVARTTMDSAAIVVPVRVPPARLELPLTGPLVVDSASVTPRGTALMLRDDEPVRVSVRAPANATAWVGGNRADHPLVNVAGNVFATDVPARDLRAAASLYVARGSDTVRLALTKVADPDTLSAPLVSLGDATAATDTDATAIGRSTPSGTYKWMLIPGTVVQRTGRVGDNVRVRLDSQLEVWVDAASVKPLPAHTPAPRRVVGAMGLSRAAEWVDVVFPLAAAPPFLVEEEIGRIVVTLYGTQASPEIIKFRQNDSLVRMMTWTPESSDRVRFSLEMTQAPYGYLTLWDPARGFVLRLRRAPRVDPRRPLAGLTIVVDPGHPPGGAIGPSALTEAQAALDVGRRLTRILEERGARVVVTRTTMAPVDLRLRSVIARRENAHALVSVHLNAFGDGTNPFTNNGTSALFFHPHSEPLARLVQTGMMREMGLRDLGVHYQNISIGRTTWMPAIICEGAFLMIPQQEYALTTPEFQERYARGVADGVEAYFASLHR